MGKRRLSLLKTELKRTERQRYGGKEKNALRCWKRAMGRKGKSYFFSDRNTAVRGAEVHSLPLNFPLKKAGYGLQAHGNFGTELSICCFGLVNESSK